MASKKFITQELNKVLDVKAIKDAVKHWVSDDPKDVTAYDTIIKKLEDLQTSFQAAKNKKLDKFNEKYFTCSKCGKYTDKKLVKQTSKKEIVMESTYRDSGYGEDDRHGEVEYLIIYKVCPHCNALHLANRMYLQTLREWDKYGTEYKR